ncbi:MAG TPA: ABC transporter permease [Acidobacteriota bacterium]|nr:ABC transporter permease [Acidobacteriota bacterium]
MKLPENALLIKEMREEMRSRKLFFLVTIYIGILSIVALVAVSNSGGSSFNPVMLSETSHFTLFSFVITVTILLGLVSTVLGAASFTTERERATFELLELTPLSCLQLVTGKFFHVLILIGLILISSLPVLSALFFMGGLTYTDLFLIMIYVALFLAVVILAALCISILSNRTIISIIFSLGLAFVISATLGILSANMYRDPGQLGFALVSPWLVAAQQIFSPGPIRLSGHAFPVWPFYFGLYALLIALFAAWGRNALDSRKLERNIWVRLIGLVILNGYLALGFLCARSYAPVTLNNVRDVYQIILVMLIVILPCFALGILTDRDRVAFEKHPFLESFHPRKLLLNYPPTGIFYLLILLLTTAFTIAYCARIPVRGSMEYVGLVILWIIPWLLIFTGMRISRARPRSILVIYLLAALLYVLVGFFRSSGKSVSTSFEFFFDTPMLGVLVASSLIYLVVVMIRQHRRKSPAK